MSRFVGDFFDRLEKPGVECTTWRVFDGNSNIKRYECRTGEDDEHFMDLSEAERKKVIVWLQYNLIEASKPLYGHSSYGMKHTLERRTNIYMTNNQFKEAMMRCGFLPVKTDELNWKFCVRKSSPMFQLQTDDKYGLPMMGFPMRYPASVADLGNVEP